MYEESAPPLLVIDGQQPRPRPGQPEGGATVIALPDDTPDSDNPEPVRDGEVNTSPYTGDDFAGVQDDEGF